MEQMKNYPGFTIFIPVKNGRNYLSPCVESILAQTYQNFELVILAGFSSDGTCEWLKNLAERDSRIKVVFSDTELGIAGNWRRILTSPKNEFMTIIGYDDLLAPNFLEEITSLIQSEPEASLYQTHFEVIDSAGKLIRHCRPIPKTEKAAEFLAARMAGIRDSFATGYVMRSKHYDAIGGIPLFSDLLYADDALWLGLMGNSFKVTSPRVCFSYRYHLDSVSGTANQVSLFAGLQQYLAFLQEMARDNSDLARVLKIYGPQYVAKWCQNYFYHLVRVAPWGQPVDPEKRREIERLMQDFASEARLDTTSTKFKLLFWRRLVNLGRGLVPLLGKNALNKL
jgi:glycosyltransferase involved in cell wall biosynthesis